MLNGCRVSECCRQKQAKPKGVQVAASATKAEVQADKPETPASSSTPMDTSTVGKDTSAQDDSKTAEEPRKRINPLKRDMDSAGILPSSQPTGSKDAENPTQTTKVDETASETPSAAKETDPEPPSKLLRKDEADTSISDAKPSAAAAAAAAAAAVAPAAAAAAVAPAAAAAPAAEAAPADAAAEEGQASPESKEEEAKKKDPIKKKLYALVGKGNIQNKLAAEAVADATKTPGGRATGVSTRAGRTGAARGQARSRGRARRGRQSASRKAE